MSGSQTSTTKEKNSNMTVLLTCRCAQPRRVSEETVLVFEELWPVVAGVCGNHQPFLVGAVSKPGGSRLVGRSLLAISCITDKVLWGSRSALGIRTR